MAALPKRKISSAKQGKRRRSIKLRQPAITKCPHCGASKRPHYRCGNCGASNAPAPFDGGGK